MDDFRNQRYSEDEVSSIIRRALQQGGASDGSISHEELIDIAMKSGVHPDKLDSVLKEQELNREIDDAKALWIKRHREDFHSHLRTYVIVIGFLIVINLMTRSYPWVIWPIVGWGVGLLLHASDTYFVSEERIERGARKILKKRRTAAKARKFAKDAAREFGVDFKSLF